ncbi:MAG: cyclic nucleotide-binding domain-containing protein [Pseudomonadota bacterium]
MFLLPQDFSLFKGIEERELIDRLDQLPIVKYPKGIAIFAEGDLEYDVLGVLRGRVEIVGKGPGGELKPVAVLKEGDLFGEFSYFTGKPRSFSAVAMEESAILLLESGWLHSASEKYPSLQLHLQALFRSRILTNVLRSSPLFSLLAPKELDDLVSKMELVAHEGGAPILKEGETSLDLYVIKQGKVAVTKAKGGTTVTLQELGPGDLFGEMAVVTGQPRSASASAIGRVELMILKGERFRDLLKNHPPLLRAIEDVVRNRAEQMRQAMETVVSDVVAEDWEEEALSAGLRVVELGVEAEIGSGEGKTRGTLEEVSARTWSVQVVAPGSPVQKGDRVPLRFPAGGQRLRQEMAKIPPLTARVEEITAERLVLGFPEKGAGAETVMGVLRLLAGAKLKGLIFPRYEAKEIEIDARILRENKPEIRGKLVWLSLTHSRIRFSGGFTPGELSSIKFERQGETLAEVKGIALAVEEGAGEFQFEYRTSEERAPLEKMIRLLSDGVGPAPTRAAPRKEAPAAPRSGLILVRTFQTAEEFIRTYITSIEAGELKVASPDSLKAGTPVRVQLVIPGFPGVKKANCAGVVRSWSKGRSVVELSDVETEVTERLRSLFEKLMSLETGKSWKERESTLMMVRKGYSVWEDPVMRRAIILTLVALNLALYLPLYLKLGKPMLR